MSNSEQEEILSTNGRPKAFKPFFNSVAEMLNSHCQQFADKQAVIFLNIDKDQEYSLSYQQLSDLVYKTANFLFQKGVRQGDHIGFLFYNSPSILILELAAGLLGASSVPLGFKRDAQERKIFKLKNTGVKVFFLKADDEDIKKEIEAIETALPAMEIISLHGHRPLEQLVDDQPVDPVFTLNNDLESEFILLYTSGTTAEPKGVPLTLKACLASSQAVIKWQNFTVDERFQVVLPLHHVNSTIFCLATLLIGGTILLYSRYSVSRFWKTIEKYKITGSSIGPTVIHDLLAKQEDYFAKGYDISSLQRIMIGSSPVLSEEAMRFVNTFKVKVFQGWGQTESAFRATGVPANLSDEQYLEAVKTNSIGIELGSCEVRVLKEDGSEAKEGEEGELCTQGAGVTTSYLNNPKETKKYVIDGWMHSGDLGFYKIINGQKFFFTKGRIKEIIIKGGVNISPVAIENALIKNFPEIDEVCVVGFFDKRMVEEIAAVVVFKKDCTTEQKELVLKRIVQWGQEGKLKGITKYESPSKAFEIKQGLPKISVGKIQRVRVKEMVRTWIRES